MLLAIVISSSALLIGGPIGAKRATTLQMSATKDSEQDSAFGASHTSFYTDAVKKDSYATLDDVLGRKMANPDLRAVLKTMFDACGTITEALRTELVTVSEYPFSNPNPNASRN